VISILDLSIHFADIQAARYGGENQFDQINRSIGLTVDSGGRKSFYEHRRRRQQRRSRRKLRRKQLQQQLEISTLNLDEYESSESDNSYDDDGDGDNDDDNDGDDANGDKNNNIEYTTFLDEGNTSCISFLDSPYGHRLRDARTQFDRLRSFVVAGLRNVGRVSSHQSWDMLADRAEWRKG